MQKLIWLLLFPATVWAQQNCVLQEKTVKQTDRTITEIANLRKDVVSFGNQKKCMVNFNALIDGKWFPAFGEHVWDGERPVSEACGAAVTKAKKDLTNSVKPSTIISEDVLICRDDGNTTKLTGTQIGSFVDVAQLRTHPSYPRRFYHNGAECRWFLDSSWNGKDIQQYQGIVCQLEPTKWVVVDKF